MASRLETAGLPPIAFAAFHALAAPRWDYLCRLESENAECHVRLDEYTEYSLCLRLGRAVLAGRALVVSRWLMRIANWPTALLAAFSSRGERHNEIIDIERQFSRIVGLPRLRGGYGGAAFMREVRAARSAMEIARIATQATWNLDKLRQGVTFVL